MGRAQYKFLIERHIKLPNDCLFFLETFHIKLQGCFLPVYTKYINAIIYKYKLY